MIEKSAILTHPGSMAIYKKIMANFEIEKSSNFQGVIWQKKRTGDALQNDTILLLNYGLIMVK